MSKNYEDLKNIEKVALILIMMKAEASAKIFQSMSEDEIKLISKAISELGTVSNEVVEKVLTEILSTVEATKGVVGNINTTKEVLLRSLDEERANSIIESITGDVWDKFKKLDISTVVEYLKEESAEVIAAVVSKIGNIDVISEILASITEQKAVEVILNIMVSSGIKPDVLSTLEQTLEKQLLSGGNKQNALLVEIFNNIDTELERKLSQQLQLTNPDLASYIKSNLFKFDDLVKVNDVGLQLLVREIDKNDLKVALRYSEESIKSILKSSMSERVLRIIQSEIETAEEVPEAEIKKSMNRVASVARKLMIEKKISLKEAVA